MRSQRADRPRRRLLAPGPEPRGSDSAGDAVPPGIVAPLSARRSFVRLSVRRRRASKRTRDEKSDENNWAINVKANDAADECDASGLLPSQQPLEIEMAFFQIRKGKVAAHHHHCVQRERGDHRIW